MYNSRSLIQYNCYKQLMDVQLIFMHIYIPCRSRWSAIDCPGRVNWERPFQQNALISDEGSKVTKQLNPVMVVTPPSVHCIAQLANRRKHTQQQNHFESFHCLILKSKLIRRRLRSQQQLLIIDNYVTKTQQTIIGEKFYSQQHRILYTILIIL